VLAGRALDRAGTAGPRYRPTHAARQPGARCGCSWVFAARGPAAHPITIAPVQR